jgi:hypothetical protein
MRRTIPLGEMLSLVMSGLALLVSVIAMLLSGGMWLADKVQKYQESLPRLTCVSDQVTYDDGYSVLTLLNLSPVTPAAITGIQFSITDPDSVARIERKDPKPEGMITMSHNESDDVVFIEGEWVSDNCYEFSMSHGFHVRPSWVNDLRLAIVNRKWAGQEFTGELTIQYSGENPPLVLSPVTIRGLKSR